MNEDKLDLILTVVSGLRNDVGELKGDVKRVDAKVDSFKIEVNSKFDALEQKFDSKFDNLEQKFDSKFDSLEKELKDFKGEFKDFKKQTIQAYKSLNGRIDILEKQMLAIGMEVKDEIRNEIRSVRADLDYFNRKLMLEQEETLRYKRKTFEFEERISKLEEQTKLAA